MRHDGARCGERDDAFDVESGELGSHQGLPITIIATAKLSDLQNGTGIETGGGTLLPVKTVIRMAADDYHLLVKDGG